MSTTTVLEKCAEQFEFYEKQHRAKGTPESDKKAEVNKEMAALCRAELATGCSTYDPDTQVVLDKTSLYSWRRRLALVTLKGEDPSTVCNAVRQSIDEKLDIMEAFSTNTSASKESGLQAELKMLDNDERPSSLEAWRERAIILRDVIDRYLEDGQTVTFVEHKLFRMKLAIGSTIHYFRARQLGETATSICNHLEKTWLEFLAAHPTSKG